MHALHRMALLVCALLLTACAGPRVIESTVNSFAQWPTGQPFTPTTYRFERLPSQNTPEAAARQDQIEGFARAALAKVGLQHEAASPQYSVQVQLLIERLATEPVWMPGWGALPGRDYLVNGRGQVIWTGMAYAPPEPQIFHRHVALVMRQISTGAVVFESSADNEGPGWDANRLLPALFEATVAGYPEPSPGTRRVQVEIAP
jgi:Domain of unknown function (DUF4136)